MRQWLKHLSIYGVGIFLLNALSFFLLPIYTHRITPGDYGVLELLNRSRDILVIVMTCGMGMATLTFFQLEGKDPNLQKKVFSTAIRGMFLSGGVLVLSLQFCSRWISAMLFYSPAYFWAVQLALWTGLFELVFQIGLISMQARFKSILYVFLTVGRLIFGMAVNIVLVVWLNWGLKGILVASLAHTVLFAFLAAAFVFRGVGFGFDWHLWREMLRFGLPFIPGSFFLFVLNNGDRYFLEAYRGTTELGIYALGYRFGQIATLVVLTPFLKVWGSVMIGTSDQPNGREHVARIATYFALAYSGVSLALSLWGPFLVRLLTGPGYWTGFSIIPIVALAYLFWGLSTITDTAFYVTKKSHLKPFIMGTAAAVCVILYAVFIPRYGMMGAAAATLMSFVFFAVLTWMVAYRYLPVRYEFGRLIKIVGAASFVYAIGYRISVGTSWVNVLGSAVLWTLYPVILYLLRFPTSEERLRLQSLWSATLSRVSIFATS